MKLIDIEEDKIYKEFGKDIFFKYNSKGEIERNIGNYSCVVSNINVLLKTEVIEVEPTKWVIVNDVEGLRIRLRQTDSIVWLSLKELEKLCEDVANEKNAPF